jgi:hypothetical protein
MNMLLSQCRKLAVTQLTKVVSQEPLPQGSFVNSAALSFTPNQDSDATNGVSHESPADVGQQALFNTMSPRQLEKR